MSAETSIPGELARQGVLAIRRRADSPPRGRFLLAGLDVVADAWPAWLEPFRREGVPAAWGPPRERAAPRPGKRIKSGTAWLLDAERQVDVWETEGGVLVSVPRIGSYLVAAEGIDLLDEALPPLRPGLAAEVLFGSIVLLALAQRGVFAVHSSLAATAAGVIGFLGPSGSGKSTVAAAAAAHGWRRLADDVTPVGLAGGTAFVRPHFPQLKLSGAEQYGAGEPSELRLKSLYRLAAGDVDTPVRVERLPEREAMLALLRETVVARLFPGTLLEEHLDFCAGVAALGVVRTLHFPRRIDALPAMLAAVARDLDLELPMSG